MLDTYRELIDELLETPAVIRKSMVSRVEPTRETRALIVELRDRDRAVMERVQAITRSDSPYLRVLKTSAGGDEVDLTALLDGMDTARGDLVSLLMNLTLRDWERGAIHETDGEITLADEIEQHVEFDEEQRRRIAELGTAQG